MVGQVIHMYYMIYNDSFIEHDNIKNDDFIGTLVKNTMMIMFPVFVLLLVIKFEIYK